MRSLVNFLSFIFIFSGLFLIAHMGLPLLVYELFSAPGVRSGLLSPLPRGGDAPVPSRSAGATGQVAGFSAGQGYVGGLTRASNWFVGDVNLPDTVSKVRYYNLSIPSLGIEQATVEIGGEDLSKSLIHYRGTVFPGKLGNAVIFGHSTLPQLFSPDNYLSIFSTLPGISLGELVYVDYDGITYTYKVMDKFEVKPTDLYVLEQKFDDSYLSLITCTPPGTYFKRLVVRARLVPPVDRLTPSNANGASP